MPEPQPDETLIGATDAARAALLEITPPSTVGDPAGYREEGDGVVSLLFENRLPGYPGWLWTVSLSRDPVDGSVNVLETELLPGDGALLAPEWVPWADRLAEYQAQQQALREAAEAAGEEPPVDELALAAASVTDADHAADAEGEHDPDDEGLDSADEDEDDLEGEDDLEDDDFDDTADDEDDDFDEDDLDDSSDDVIDDEDFDDLEATEEAALRED